MNKTFCDICNKKFKNIEDHNRSQMHKLRLEFIKNGDIKQTEYNLKAECKLCNKKIGNIYTHNKSKKHQINKKYFEEHNEFPEENIEEKKEKRKLYMREYTLNYYHTHRGYKHCDKCNKDIQIGSFEDHLNSVLHKDHRKHKKLN